MSVLHLHALNEHSGATARTAVTVDFQKDALRLFGKIYGRKFGHVSWHMGWPGKDTAVVFKATPFEGSEEWLHLSYSDGRVWPMSTSKEAKS